MVGEPVIRPVVGSTVTALRWIVKLRIEHNHVSPLRMVGNNDRLAHAIIHSQVLAHLPGVLSETLVPVRPKHV